MKFKILIILFAIILFACKEHDKINENEVQTKEEAIKTPNKLVFEIDLKTSKPDDFRLFAYDIFLNNSQFMDISIVHKLNNNETAKKMHFEFPENIKPDFQLGFSLGPKMVKDVEINNIILRYGDLTYNVSSTDIIKYFRPSKFVEYNEETGVFKTKKVNGKHNPILFLRRSYLDKILDIK